jgi:hypothetical protein
MLPRDLGRRLGGSQVVIPSLELIPLHLPVRFAQPVVAAFGGLARFLHREGGFQVDDLRRDLAGFGLAHRGQDAGRVALGDFPVDRRTVARALHVNSLTSKEISPLLCARRCGNLFA